MFEDAEEPPKPVRGERGRWKKGVSSPNPGGYSKAQRAARKDVREAAKRLTPLALKTLQRIMENPKAPASAKAQAVAIVLDRAWGKVPVQDGELQPQEIIVKWMDESSGIDPAGDRARAQQAERN